MRLSVFLRALGRGSRRDRVASGDEVEARLDRQRGRIAALERELARVSPQVAALESRLEDLREAGEVEREEGRASPARDLVEEVRREHQRVRVRISAAARYEERLRILEEKVQRLEEVETGKSGSAG